MNAIKYTIETVNPIIISNNGSDRNMRATKTYINGNSILGLLASKFIHKQKISTNAHKNPDFYELFLNNGLTFSNAYLTENNNIYSPSPQSIKKEKYDENNIYDLLFVDDKFDKSTKSVSEYLKIDGDSILISTVHKKISFHHARDRKTGTAQKGVVFNYESIASGQLFTGNIIGIESNLKKVKNSFENTFIAYLGRSKNNEYGKVKISLSEIKSYDREIDYDYENGGEEVVMTFLSDAIVYNENGFSTTEVKDLEKIINIEIEKSFIENKREEKFVGIWKCKNQSENCFKAGSTFLLKELPSDYEEIEKVGIGERTNEGYGRVIFGYQENKNINGSGNYSLKIKKEKDEIRRPDVPIPDKVKTICSDIIKEKMKNITVKKAMEDADKFNRIPSNSLIGKLSLLSKDYNEFNGNFSKVIEHAPAKNKLRKCNNKKQTLIEFLNRGNFLSDDDYTDNVLITNLLKALSIPLPQIIVKLNQLYLETFLKSLKWKNKQMNTNKGEKL